MKFITTVIACFFLSNILAQNEAAPTMSGSASMAIEDAISSLENTDWVLVGVHYLDPVDATVQYADKQNADLFRKLRLAVLGQCTSDKTVEKPLFAMDFTYEYHFSVDSNSQGKMETKKIGRLEGDEPTELEKIILLWELHEDSDAHLIDFTWGFLDPYGGFVGEQRSFRVQQLDPAMLSLMDLECPVTIEFGDKRIFGK